jgi:hypothetical protein
MMRQSPDQLAKPGPAIVPSKLTAASADPVLAAASRYSSRLAVSISARDGVEGDHVGVNGAHSNYGLNFFGCQLACAYPAQHSIVFLFRHKFLLLMILDHWLAQRLENLTQIEMQRTNVGKPNSRKEQGLVQVTSIARLEAG